MSCTMQGDVMRRKKKDRSRHGTCSWLQQCGTSHMHLLNALRSSPVNACISRAARSSLPLGCNPQIELECIRDPSLTWKPYWNGKVDGKTGNHRLFQTRQFSYYALYKETIFWCQRRVPPTKGQFHHDPIVIYICLHFIIFSMEKREITGCHKQGNFLTTPCIKKSFFCANQGSPPQRVNSIMIPL